MAGRDIAGHGRSGTAEISSHDPHATDPPLLRNHSAIVNVETSHFTYRSIRVFFKRHEQEDQLPVDPAPLPLLVFIHGLGGSIAQFHPLLTRLSNCASCLAVDLPGCGRSAFSPLDWDAYSFEALVELLQVALARYQQPEQGLVLIGHSMGCSLAAALASRQPVSGLVAICPAAGLLDQKKIAFFKALLWIPTFLFDLWRAWDSRGGLESPSVRRFIGNDADEVSKRLQERFNNQSKTPVWRRMAWGSLPKVVSGRAVGGLAGKVIWATLDLPVCLIAGECDHITPPAEAKQIASFLCDLQADGSYQGHTAGATGGNRDGGLDTKTPSAAVAPSAAIAALPARTSDPTSIPEETISKSYPCDRDSPRISDIADADFGMRKTPPDDDIPTTPAGSSDRINIPVLQRHPPKFVESHVVPAPANHALPYMPATVGVVSGLIANFLAQHVTGRLDRGWQLRFLAREGKWDVKNLEKWTKVEPVSKPIAGIFRAMKTLRQVDEVHSPKCFVKNWAHVVKDVIDISHDSPVYDTRDLEAGGIHYHKFPTVSKIAPTKADVELFDNLVDSIRLKQKMRAISDHLTEETLIGVHCHYGFNRTGYFIVCYLVDRCGFTLQDAVQAFADARPAGIRHSHFLDALSLRYTNVTNDVVTS